MLRLTCHQPCREILPHPPLTHPTTLTNTRALCFAPRVRVRRSQSRWQLTKPCEASSRRRRTSSASCRRSQSLTPPPFFFKLVGSVFPHFSFICFDALLLIFPFFILPLFCSLSLHLPAFLSARLSTSHL